MNNKLVLIDGNSLFYRAFYALPLLQNEKGEYTNAIYGFCNFLIKIIEDLKPTHMMVAFDASKHTFRHNLYSEYKATRKPMPTELASQAQPLRELLKLMGIKVLEKAEIEADDILGTIAHRFNDDTTIVTGDRDCFQLINWNTNVCFTKKGLSEIQLIDVEEFKKQYGFMPINIIDLKALQGDSADNIPGGKGIGEKTALKLIQEYTNIENVFQNISNINGSLKDKLVNSRDVIFLSKKLATIDDNVDIACVIDDCKITLPFPRAVYDRMMELNFRSIIKRENLFEHGVGNEEIHIVSTKKVIADTDELEKFIGFVKNEKILSVVMVDDSFHLSFGSDEYVLRFEDIALNVVLSYLGDIFSDSDIKKIFFDTKQMMHVLFKYNIDLQNYFDIALAKHLVDGVGIKDFASVLESEGIDVESVALNFLELKTKYENKLNELGMMSLYTDVELPLIEVLFSMEQTGFKVDLDKLEELRKEYELELDSLKKRIWSIVGCNFNIDSPKQLGDVLFNKLGLRHDKKMSTNIEQLMAIEGDHEIVPLIIRYRKIAKLNGTYIKGVCDRIGEDGRIHTNFKQTLTNTGRLSSTDPNLQNLPIKTDESRQIRSMFTASSVDNVLIDVDYSQIELRLLAHMSEDPIFVEAFKNNEDIHTSTACGIFNCEPSDVTREMRRMAKVVNFGVIYGISDFGLAKDLGISPKEAKKYIDSFYDLHIKVGEFMQHIVESAKATGRVYTLLGRSRKMLDITASNRMIRMRAERASQNMALQGSAADIIKLAMVNVYKKLKNTGAKLIMQVHDELVVDCPKDEANAVYKIVKEEMENAMQLIVPLSVDGSISYRWSEGH